jgi:uncharacterized SAM-binding protein YcdF (DUF218 family)
MPAMKGHHLDDASGLGPGHGFEAAARKRRLPALLRATGWMVFCCAALFLGGFALFATHVGRMSTPENPPAADAIIVLTGGQARLDAALGLLKSGKGERLLISGVHTSTSSKMLQAATGGDKALFSCCVDIDRAALDTIGNAEESAKWVQSHAYQSVILVTNNYHMPRSLLELRRANPGIEFIAYPVVNSDLKSTNWLHNPMVLKTILSEYAKLTIASVRDALGAHPASGLRTENKDTPASGN